MVVSAGLFLWLALTVRSDIALISALLYTVIGIIMRITPFDTHYVLLSGIVPVLVGYTIIYDRYIEAIVTKGSLVTMAMVLTAHLSEKMLFNDNIPELLNEVMLKSLESAGNILPDVAIDFTNNMEMVFGYLYPYTLFSFSLFYFLGLFIMAGIYKKLKIANFYIHPLGSMRYKTIPSLMLLGIILVLFLIRENSETMKVVIDNLLLICESLFALQGVSVVFYLLRKKGFTSGLSLGITLPIILVPLLQQIAGFVGIMDNFWDFRKMEKFK